MSTVDNLTIQDNIATLAISEFNFDTYQDFLKIKGLPRYRVEKAQYNGTYQCIFPAEYAQKFGGDYTPQTEPLPLSLPDFLFDRQEVAIKVCWVKKRYALFWDAGLGKTLVFGELARQLSAISKKCLIVSPLNVIHQTIETMTEFYGDDYPRIVNLHGTKDDALESFKASTEYNIAIVNHMWFRQERDLSGINAVFLDESSILKNSAGTLSKNMVACTKGMEYKYCFSATPAPNARLEYGRHAVYFEFMSSDKQFEGKFFVQKDRGFVMRRHCKKAFYDFLASWSMFMRNPQAYGFKDVIDLPPFQEITQKVEMLPEQVELINQTLEKPQLTLAGMPENPDGFRSRQTYNQVSKGFLYQGTSNNRTIITVPSNKPKTICDFLLQHSDRKAIIWCVYDEEGEILLDYLSNHTGFTLCHLTGKTPQEKRAGLVDDFRHGKADVMITKPKLLGLGLNLHVASINVFSGLNDSAEAYYQAMKRCWRYPQKQEVINFLPYTEYESAILQNVLGKREKMEADFTLQETMYAESGFDEIREYLETDKMPTKKEHTIMLDPVITDQFKLYHADSIESMLKGIADNTVDFALFSPPFPGDIFAYTDQVADMGNTGGIGALALDEYNAHLLFLLKGVYRSLKPGRIMAIEISQIPLRQGLDGHIGMRDVCGSIIDLACKAGFFQFGEWVVLGNPQAEAIVKHISTLNMNHVRKDRSKLAPMINDYILVFKKPGENETPITNRIAYYPLSKILEYDTKDISTSDTWHNAWNMFQKEPAKNEWVIMQINDDIQVRAPGLLYLLNMLKNIKENPPSYIKVENDEWLVPVEIAEFTNEEWIERADGIIQYKSFNRDKSMHNATKQKERFNDHLSRVEQEYDKVRAFFEEMDTKMQTGELTKKEIMQMFSGALLDIDQTNTLNTPYTRGRTKEIEDADKHLCPFSIPLVDLLIRMYSNEGDLVSDTFCGVGTVPMVAIRRNRKAIGWELKEQYFNTAVEVCLKEISKPQQLTLF